MKTIAKYFKSPIQSFFWFHQESGATGGPGSSPSKTVESKESSTPIKKDPSGAKALATEPLSPYVV